MLRRSATSVRFIDLRLGSQSPPPTPPAFHTHRHPAALPTLRRPRSAASITPPDRSTPLPAQTHMTPRSHAPQFPNATASASNNFTSNSNAILGSTGNTNVSTPCKINSRRSPISRPSRRRFSDSVGVRKSRIRSHKHPTVSFDEAPPR
jgi:hypothetical protein